MVPEVPLNLNQPTSPSEHMNTCCLIQVCRSEAEVDKIQKVPIHGIPLRTTSKWQPM